MERAQAAFHKKEIQAREGATATAEYKAAGQAERAKTERRAGDLLLEALIACAGVSLKAAASVLDVPVKSATISA